MNWNLTPIALGVFFLVATCIVAAVAMALFFAGSVADLIWQLKPDRQALLTPYAPIAAPAFAALAMVMFLACIGCFRRRKWGWWLAVCIFAANGIGDLTQLLLGRIMEGGVGVIVVGALLFYLTRPHVRAAFT